MDKGPIYLVPNLQSYFYENLNSLNKKSLCPVPSELIYYSSEIMEKFSLSEELFDQSSGKPRNKILGMSLLEAQMQNFEEKIKNYRDVGDMSLFLCGYFGKSMNNKIHDTDYYCNLGKKAYLSLDKLVPSYLDIPCFYKTIANCYDNLLVLMSLVATFDQSDPHKHLLLETNDSHKETDLIKGIIAPSKKVS